MALTPNKPDNQRDVTKNADRARNIRKPAPLGGEETMTSEEALKKGTDSAADQTSFVTGSNEYRKNKRSKARVG